MGVYLFTDMDRLSAEDRQRAQAIWTQLRTRPDCRAINEPEACLRRFDLLRRLHAEGINSFRAHPIDAPPESIRFPAFIRLGNDHDGARTPVLRTLEELAAAVRTLPTRRPEQEWLIVEFCDTADAQGRYRKWSAFRVGARIIPRHLYVDRDWCIKYGGSRDPAARAEEWAYVTENPHREQLLRVFELARIEYGRVDYAFLDGRIQVWEINTNPQMPWWRNFQERPRRRVHALAHDRLTAALRELDGSARAGAGYPAEWLRTGKRVGWHAAMMVPGAEAAVAGWWRWRHPRHQSAA